MLKIYPLMEDTGDKALADFNTLKTELKGARNVKSLKAFDNSPRLYQIKLEMKDMLYKTYNVYISRDPKYATNKHVWVDALNSDGIGQAVKWKGKTYWTVAEVISWANLK